MTAKVPSLKEWAAAHGLPKRAASFIDSLPAELREQIAETADDPTISTRDIVYWLHSLGFEDATSHKVARFRTEVKHGRV
jgi:hypothetical protein